MGLPDGVQAQIKDLITQLVKGHLIELHRRGLLGKGSLDIIREVLSEYPGEITLPPDSAFVGVDVYGDFNKGTFSADVPLWFGHKQSDLIATIAQDQITFDRLYIHDLRVQ